MDVNFKQEVLVILIISVAVSFVVSELLLKF